MASVSRDVVAGVVVVIVGIVFFVGSLELRTGTTMSMGPGYFPLVVSGIVVVLGSLIAVGGFIDAQPSGEIHWRPLLAVSGAIAAFALVMTQFGLIPAMVAGVAISALGDRSSRVRETLLVAVAAALGAWLVFRVGLGLQLPGIRIPGWWS